MVTKIISVDVKIFLECWDVGGANVWDAETVVQWFFQLLVFEFTWTIF